MAQRMCSVPTARIVALLPARARRRTDHGPPAGADYSRTTMQPCLQALWVAIALGAWGCASEPPFIDQCQRECDCTHDSFACRIPRMEGCDNLWRRDWALANQH